MQSDVGSRQLHDRIVPVAKVYTCTGAQTAVPEHDPPQVGYVADEHGVTPMGKQPQAVGGKFSSGTQYVPAGHVPLQAA